MLWQCGLKHISPSTVELCHASCLHRVPGSFDHPAMGTYDMVKIPSQFTVIDIKSLAKFALNNIEWTKCKMDFLLDGVNGWDLKIS